MTRGRTDGYGQPIGPRGPVKSPARVLIQRVVEDGNWHEVEALAAMLVGVVDPGVASRRYHQVSNLEPWIDGVDPADRVRRGLRVLVQDVLTNMRSAGWKFETEGFNKTRRVRLIERVDEAVARWRQQKAIRQAKYRAKLARQAAKQEV